MEVLRWVAAHSSWCLSGKVVPLRCSIRAAILNVSTTKLKQIQSFLLLLPSIILSFFLSFRVCQWQMLLLMLTHLSAAAPYHPSPAADQPTETVMELPLTSCSSLVFLFLLRISCNFFFISRLCCRDQWIHRYTLGGPKV